MIKAILFDVDNTLVDFMQMKHKSCEAAIEAMRGAGLKISKQDALKLLYEIYNKYGIEYQLIFQEFLKRTKGKVDPRLLAHGIIAYRKIREANLTPYSGTIPTLIKLSHKYKLAIVSDAPRMQAWLRLVQMNLDGFFDVVVTRGDVKRQKTHFAPFRAALKALNIKPEEALMIGDKIPRDIETAKKLGIKTCYARYGDTHLRELGKSGADFEINDISELPEILERMQF